MTLEVGGRAAIITGAASGIGRALAMAAAERRMTIAIADINAAGLAETEQMLRDRQINVLASVVDVSEPDAVRGFADTCFGWAGSIAMVWANAGIQHYGSAVRPDLQKWRQVIDVNLMGPIHFVDAFLGRMVDRGEPARFVITGSLASFVAGPEIGAYVAAKHGLWGLAETLRIELAQRASPVQVSLLCPGRVATGILGTTTERVRAQGGDAAVDRFLAGLTQSDEMAHLAMEQALAGDFLIAPQFDEVRDMFRARVAGLL